MNLEKRRIYLNHCRPRKREGISKNEGTEERKNETEWKPRTETSETVFPREHVRPSRQTPSDLPNLGLRGSTLERDNMRTGFESQFLTYEASFYKFEENEGWGAWHCLIAETKSCRPAHAWVWFTRQTKRLSWPTKQPFHVNMSL